MDWKIILAYSSRRSAVAINSHQKPIARSRVSCGLNSPLVTIVFPDRPVDASPNFMTIKRGATRRG